MSRVDIFGSYHVDRPSKVRAELSEFSAGADVFFTEDPREDPNADETPNVETRNPAFWLMARLVDVVWGVIGFLLTRQFRSVDAAVTRQVAQNRDIPIEPVDKDLTTAASIVSLPVTILSWLWFVLVLVVAAFAVATYPFALLVFGLPVPWTFFGGMSVLLGFGPVAPFALLTVSDRDRAMAANIEEILTERGEINKGVLVVGDRHVEGVVAELEDGPVEVGETHSSTLFMRTM
jgi:hypothetical protein